MKKLYLSFFMILLSLPALAVTTVATEPWVRSGLNTKADKTQVATDIANAISGITITETDPTVPAWAKAATKPTYTATEVGARPNTWVPSYNDLTDAPSAGITTETDPTVPAWAKTAAKPTYTYSELTGTPPAPTGTVMQTGANTMSGTYVLTGTMTVPNQTLPQP